MKTPTLDKLDIKERRFVIELVLSGMERKGDAAARAGYSERSASNIASKLLAKEKIQKAIREVQKAVGSDEDFMGPEEVKRILTGIGRATITDFASWNGETISLKSSEEIPQDSIHAVKSIRSERDGIRLDLHDKLRAIESIAKIHGMMKEEEGKKVTLVVKGLDLSDQEE